jgi:hypothetical protein
MELDYGTNSSQQIYGTSIQRKNHSIQALHSAKRLVTWSGRPLSEQINHG